LESACRGNGLGELASSVEQCRVSARRQVCCHLSVLCVHLFCGFIRASEVSGASLEPTKVGGIARCAAQAVPRGSDGRNAPAPALRGDRDRRTNFDSAAAPIPPRPAVRELPYPCDWLTISTSDLTELADVVNAFVS
jgi:hypothetical protein